MDEAHGTRRSGEEPWWYVGATKSGGGTRIHRATVQCVDRSAGVVDGPSGTINGLTSFLYLIIMVGVM